MKRIAIRSALAVAIVLLASSLAAILIFRSGWFHERLRERVIAEIENSTGGRVEMGDFNFNWEHFTATIAPLIIHGTEPAGDPPLLTVRSVTLGLRIVSMLERKVDLASLYVEQPVAHVVFYPGGGTNLPTPRVRDSKSWAEGVLKFAVGRYEIVNGVLDYSDRVIPLNWRGEDLRVKMAYDPVNVRYRGDLAFRRARVMTAEFGPVDLEVAGEFAFDKSRIAISRLRINTKESRADLSGVLEDVRSPRGTLNVKSTISVREAIGIFRLPIAGAGKATVDGRRRVRYTVRFQLRGTGERPRASLLVRQFENRGREPPREREHDCRQTGAESNRDYGCRRRHHRYGRAPSLSRLSLRRQFRRVHSRRGCEVCCNRQAPAVEWNSERKRNRRCHRRSTGNQGACAGGDRSDLRSSPNRGPD
jgi:hypothetical protein